MTARDVSPIRFVPARPAMGAYSSSMPQTEPVGDVTPKLSPAPGFVDFSEPAEVVSMHQPPQPQVSNPVLDELIRRQDEELALSQKAEAQGVSVIEADQSPGVEDLRPKRTPAQIEAAEKLAQANRDRAAARRAEKAAKTSPPAEKPAPAEKPDDTETEDLF